MTRLMKRIVWIAAIVGIGDVEATDLSVLGANSWERINGSVDMTVDDRCEYALTLLFQPKTDNLPIVPEVQERDYCVPPSAGGTAHPNLYSGDNRPFFQDRWHWESFPAYMQAAFGFNHLSIDWNACGHPPFDLFGRVHVDLHFYLVTPEFRADTMVCDRIGTSPRCDPAGQTTPEGEDFFVLPERAQGSHVNVPLGFEFRNDTVIFRMGAHLWDFEQQPVNVSVWEEPITIVGTYGGKVIFFEPMIPYTYISGDTANSFSDDLTYAQPTIPNMPTSYSVDYDETTEQTTVVLRGKSSVCQDDFNEMTKEDNEPSAADAHGGWTTFTWFFTVVSSLLLGVI